MLPTAKHPIAMQESRNLVLGPLTATAAVVARVAMAMSDTAVLIIREVYRVPQFSQRRLMTAAGWKT